MTGRSAGQAPELEQQVLAALGGAQPMTALRDLLVERRRLGESRESLYEGLTRIMLALRAQDREREEDLVLDAMDLLVGWCAPDARVD